MATIPVVDTVDKRIGIISAVALLFITIIVLLLLTYDIPNPLPTIRKVPTKAMVDEIILKELVVEGAVGGGTPSANPIDKPKPQKLQSITSTKPSQTSTQTGGQANNTNTQNNTDNSSSSTQQSSNPFGDGGDGGGTGGGSGTGFGPDSGKGTGSGGPGIGFGKGRIRQNNVKVQGISIETDAKIYFKLTVDSDGNVVDFSHYASKTTTTNQNLINQIGYAIKKQVKYNKAANSPLVYQDYTISVKAT